MLAESTWKASSAQFSLSSWTPEAPRPSVTSSAKISVWLKVTVGACQGRRSFQKGELKTCQVCLRLVKSQFRKIGVEGRLPMICNWLIVRGGRKVRVIQNALIPDTFGNVYSRGPQLLALRERLTNPLRHTAFCSELKRTQTWLLRPVLSQPNCSASPDCAQQLHSPQSLRSCARLIPRFSNALQNCCVHTSLHNQWEWAFL